MLTHSSPELVLLSQADDFVKMTHFKFGKYGFPVAFRVMFTISKEKTALGIVPTMCA